MPIENQPLCANRSSSCSSVIYIDLVSLDGVAGECYRAVFFTASYGFDALEHLHNAQFSQPSGVICSKVQMKINFARPPATNVGIGVPMSPADIPRVVVTTPVAGNRAVASYTGPCEDDGTALSLASLMVGEAEQTAGYTQCQCGMDYFPGAVAAVAVALQSPIWASPQSLEAQVAQTSNMFAQYVRSQMT